MKYFQFFFLCLLLNFSCTSNHKNQLPLKEISEYFPKEKAQVLVVGTFHFDYPGLDAHKTSSEDKIDVLKEPKKSEVTQLVNYIKKFKPNKIAIEAFENWNATEKFRSYKSGEYQNNRDERFQLAMRIASELKLDTLYSIDTETMAGDLEKIDSSYAQALFKDFDFQSDDIYENYYRDQREAEDKAIPKMNLLDYFKYINSKEYHQYDYGAYLIGDFKLGDSRGADIISSWWYNRNLRIFRKLQLITENANDRILLVFGNGHASVLRQVIEASPEYEFIEFDNL
ncbi:DUF5694 domain-containing protein [Aegicerativicinus sediminis]|uniref:DUF5694 domain-containing protein n=1 Tax=Aegicerativicinus sediminis TaxID=2893202 RepID=UPI001E40121A|nr:DUF5694 domain-containing protein [Aegicerativicinus sediminis]